MKQHPEPTVGALIVRKDGKILLTSSPKFFGKWVVPGGHVELGETLEAALKREIREELSIEIDVGRLAMVGDFIFDPCFHKKKHFIFHDFVCRHVSGKPKADGRELAEAKWFSAKEALAADLEPHTRKALVTYLNKLPCYQNKSRKPE